MKRNNLILLIFIFFIPSVFSKSLLSKNKIIQTIEKVNNHWQGTHPDSGNAFWDNAVYQTGNIAAYSVTQNIKFLRYAEAWADKNKWMGATSANQSAWKYSYGEKPEYVMFGDWQVCFQTYIDLFALHPDSNRIARALEVMNFQINTTKNDYWWWADGLYMVMPVMTKMFKLTGDTAYLDKLTEYFDYAKSIMYDSETGFFYRDAKYVYTRHQTTNGKKDFWARGNGWVFAGLAKVLSDMPADYKNRKLFVQHYLQMAAALIKTQQKNGGYWTRSLLDPAHAPGYETSGTAFFTYGLLWGVRNGYLKKSEYLPTAIKSWKYLTTIALQPDGVIGYVQPIGEKAIPGQVVNAGSTANFGVGAFLLAASEMYLLKNKYNSKFR